MYLLARLRTCLARRPPAARAHRQTCIGAPLQHERDEAPRQRKGFLSYRTKVAPEPRRFSSPRTAVVFSTACRPCLDASLLSHRLNTRMRNKKQVEQNWQRH